MGGEERGGEGRREYIYGIFQHILYVAMHVCVGATQYLYYVDSVSVIIFTSPKVSSLPSVVFQQQFSW